MKHYRNTMWNGIHITIIGKYNLPQEKFLCVQTQEDNTSQLLHIKHGNYYPLRFSVPVIQILAIKWMLRDRCVHYLKRCFHFPLPILEELLYFMIEGENICLCLTRHSPTHALSIYKKGLFLFIRKGDAQAKGESQHRNTSQVTPQAVFLLILTPPLSKKDLFKLKQSLF